MSGVVRRDLGAGWRFQLALEILQALHTARSSPQKGLSIPALADTARVTASYARSRTLKCDQDAAVRLCESKHWLSQSG